MATSLTTLIVSRRLWPITLAQACGALNDNLVKNAMVVLALFRLGAGGTGLSALAGALFIVPFILLSATAGVLADRYPKPRLVAVYKLTELALVLGATLAFLTASIPGLLAVLVGLGMQAALFGPVKYGVLPEYLASDELVGGNGIIEATTFLAIVCGTVAGGGLMLLPDGSLIVSLTCVALSLIGLFGALRMPKLPAADPTLRPSWNLVQEAWRVCRSAAGVRPIWLSVLGLSWFWTMGATLMTEFPIITRDTMQAGGSVLTLLLAVFAVGVGIGSIVCARLAHGSVSARFVPFAAAGISVFCWDFAAATMAARGLTTADAAMVAPEGLRMLVDLLLLAACGGLFSVPLYAIIQRTAAAAERSRMVAANNIMNALFMVLGAAAAALEAGMGLDPPNVLRVAAGVNLVAALWIGAVLRRRTLTAEAVASEPQ